MNRRQFLESIGLGASVLLIHPGEILATDPRVEVFKEYPKLYFTGLNTSVMSETLAGQFLWATQFVDMDDVESMTHWYLNLATSRFELINNRAKIKDAFRFKLQHALAEVTRMMDKSISDALDGRAQLAKWEQIPNPDFNPDLPESTGWEDDVAYNPRYVNGNPVFTKIKSFKFKDFGKSHYDAWNIDTVLNEVAIQFQ